MPEIAFSFNRRTAPAPVPGLGRYDFDSARVVPVLTRSLAGEPLRPGLRATRGATLDSLSRYYGIDLSVPFGKLPKKARPPARGA